jgi:hypothetical protein
MSDLLNLEIKRAQILADLESKRAELAQTEAELTRSKSSRPKIVVDRVGENCFRVEFYPTGMTASRNATSYSSGELSKDDVLPEIASKLSQHFNENF